MRGILSVVLALSASVAHAHYSFPWFYVNGTLTGEYEYVRISENRWGGAPITDVTSSKMRCYELDPQATPGQTKIATVVAGSTVGFKASNTMGHPGYFSAYMTPASPSANSPNAGLGATWFKVWEWGPRWESKDTGLIYDSINAVQVNFTLPKSIPNGEYLLRIEQIALHVASTFGGAQFYVNCAQIKVTGGGSGKPSPTGSIPGIYTGREPGILMDYAAPYKDGYGGYPLPGLKIWKG